MPWRPEEISFEIIDDETDDPVVTVRIDAPVLGYILIMAEVEERGRTLRLLRTHIHSRGSNTVGLTNLRLLADIAMERMDYDAIEVEGAVRTSGANPGHRPRTIRFARRSRSASSR
jgi:hypothetical protein